MAVRSHSNRFSVGAEAKTLQKYSAAHKTALLGAAAAASKALAAMPAVEAAPAKAGGSSNVGVQQHEKKLSTLMLTAMQLPGSNEADKSNAENSCCSHTSTHNSIKRPDLCCAATGNRKEFNKRQHERQHPKRQLTQQQQHNPLLLLRILREPHCVPARSSSI